MTEWAAWLIPAISAAGAFAGAWGAVHADLRNLKMRVERLEKTLDVFMRVNIQEKQ